MYYSTTAITTSSGQLATLGSGIRWEFLKVDEGYVIRLASNPTLYLGVSADLDLPYICMVPVEEATIPTRCVWTITMASSGAGYILQNKYDEDYLYSTDTTAYTYPDLSGYPKYIDDSARTWRIVGTASYGNTSSYNMRELTSSFSISDMTLNVGETKAPVINKSNSKTIWATPSDFTYTDYEKSILDINPITGEIKARKEGATQVTVEHKVTGHKTTFQVMVLSLLIYQTARTYYYDGEGKFAEDLRALDWINWTDFVGYTPEMYREQWESMCTSLFSMGDVQTVILDMIDHFMGGTEEEYSNELLTNAVVEHSSTINYVNEIENHFRSLMTTYDGDIGQFEYTPQSRDENPFVKAVEDARVDLPVYIATLFGI